MNKLHALLCAGLLLSAGTALAEDYTVSSPSGNIQATVSFTSGKLTYSVTKDGRLLVAESPLGLKTAAVDLSEGLTFVSSVTAEVDTPYSLPVGKRSQYRDHCNILSVVTEKNSLRQTVQFRLYDDGFAFRYVLPKYGSNVKVSLTGETSRIRVNSFKDCLAFKFRKNIQDPDYPYEGHYAKYSTWSSLVAAEDDRFNSPTLVSDGTDYMLISEADNRGIFCTSLIKAEPTVGEFSYAWTGETKDYAEDKEQTIVCTLPAYTPWRMVVAGDLATVFETTMAENLCPATSIEDMSWIKPGVCAWYWGGSDGNKVSVQKKYGSIKDGEYAHADFAVEMGWPYTLIDGGWSSSWVPQLVEHANQNGVECLLWQTARLSDNQSFSNANMEKTLKQWAAWGIKGIKIDFWEDDSKETMTRMENLLKLCGKYKMLVNFHGCTRPSGLRRTYPYLVTQEGIYGGENNFWAPGNISAEHHLNLMFTRNVVGAADYTPGDFATQNGSLITRQSMGHHMALMTAFESGIVHIAECPENLRYFLGKDIMKRLPTVWDETKLLEGQVGQYATVARRHGDDWWVSGINVNARTCKVTFDFLDEGKTYTAYIYRDGTCRTDLKFSKVQVTKGESVNLKEISEGGFLMQVSTRDDLDVPAERVTYEAESMSNMLTGNGKRNSYSTLHASGGGYVGYIGLGNKLQFNKVMADKAGDYLLTVYYMTEGLRVTQLLVNGEQVGDTVKFQGNYDMVKTFNPEGMGWKMIPVKLKEGANTITFQSYADMWGPNFDRITIHPLQVDGDGVKDVSQAVFTDDKSVYNLSGVHLPTPPDSGVFIQSGKKYLKQRK
ncbi:MAG: glycoside hydrolase family 97 catalytic domain-containing protein [Bacteroidaceae bacterium]